jgi:hypothetical protein
MRPRAGAGDAVPLVGVRLEVVSEAEHAFGNLFHRLRYLAQKLDAKGVEGVAALEGALTDLEDLLRLVLDYTSPLAVVAQPVGADTVVRSLASALARPVPAFGGEGLRVIADAGHLSEAFGLMRRALGGDSGVGDPLEARVEESEGSRWLHLDGFEPGRNGIAGGAAMVAWAQAQKLVEAQGGLLQAEGEGEGVRWSVRLPLPREER